MRGQCSCQYSLERIYGLLEGRRGQKVTDPVSLAHWEPQEIETSLKAAGCDRGRFMTKLFAERLAALGVLIRTKGIDECEKVIISKNTKENCESAAILRLVESEAYGGTPMFLPLNSAVGSRLLFSIGR